jgi:hypothetical protein
MGEEIQSRYTYRLEWSEDRYQYSAKCLEIDGLYATAPTAQEEMALARALLQKLADRKPTLVW